MITPQSGVQGLHGVDREAAAWLGAVEHRAVLPLKWIVLALCAVYWVWDRGGAPPEALPFGLFVFFAGLTAGEHYFFARDRITPRQVRPFVYASFALDALFVAALAAADTMDPPHGVSELNVLFVLAVLRGFALLRSGTENALGFLLVSMLFSASAAWQLRGTPLVEFLPALRELALLWGVMLVMQAFVGLVNARQEEEWRARERQVRGASLASLGELAAGVAHEINNPIGIIRTYADYLERSAPAGDPNREDFQAIRREAERCEEIVRRMLDFSNPRVGALESIAVETLLRDTVAFVFHAGQVPEITVEFAAPEGGVPRVLGDAVQLRQAFLNVLLNAQQILTDHTPTQPAEYRPRVEVRLLRGDGPRAPVRIEVDDNGPGITPEDAERAFEPFYTRRAKGTGLGLAITRRILEAHRGRITLAPRPGGGCRVAIDLPMEGEEAA